MRRNGKSLVSSPLESQSSSNPLAVHPGEESEVATRRPNHQAQNSSSSSKAQGKHGAKSSTSSLDTTGDEMNHFSRGAVAGDKHQPPMSQYQVAQRQRGLESSIGHGGVKAKEFMRKVSLRGKTSLNQGQQVGSQKYRALKVSAKVNLKKTQQMVSGMTQDLIVRAKGLPNIDPDDDPATSKVHSLLLSQPLFRFGSSARSGNGSLQTQVLTKLKRPGIIRVTINETIHRTPMKRVVRPHKQLLVGATLVPTKSAGITDNIEVKVQKRMDVLASKDHVVDWSECSKNTIRLFWPGLKDFSKGDPITIPVVRLQLFGVTEVAGELQREFLVESAIDVGEVIKSTIESGTEVCFKSVPFFDKTRVPGYGSISVSITIIPHKSFLPSRLDIPIDERSLRSVADSLTHDNGWMHDGVVRTQSSHRKVSTASGSNIRHETVPEEDDDTSSVISEDGNKAFSKSGSIRRINSKERSSDSVSLRSSARSSNSHLSAAKVRSSMGSRHAILLVQNVADAVQVASAPNAAARTQALALAALHAERAVNAIDDWYPDRSNPYRLDRVTLREFGARRHSVVTDYARLSGLGLEFDIESRVKGQEELKSLREEWKLCQRERRDLEKLFGEAYTVSLSNYLKQQLPVKSVALNVIRRFFKSASTPQVPTIPIGTGTETSIGDSSSVLSRSSLGSWKGNRGSVSSGRQSQKRLGGRKASTVSMKSMGNRWKYGDLTVAQINDLYGELQVKDTTSKKLSRKPAIKSIIPSFASEKNVVITGATRGIGLATLRCLAAHHVSKVILICRDKKTGREVRQEMKEQFSCDVEVLLCDLAVPTQVAHTTAAIRAMGIPIHLLILMAAEFTAEREIIKEVAVEKMFAVNYLANFILCRGLLPVLTNTETTSRIVFAGCDSPDMLGWNLDFDNLHGKRDGQLNQYARTKLMTMMLVGELSRRLRKQALADGSPACVVNMFNPGSCNANLVEHIIQNFSSTSVNRVAKALYKMMNEGVLIRPAIQAATLGVFLAASEKLAGVSGQYFNSGLFGPLTEFDPKPLRGSALSASQSNRLWKYSEKVLSKVVENSKR